MCIVCIEIAKGKLTTGEARRAFAEIAMDPEQVEHVRDVLDGIDWAEKEIEQEVIKKRVQVQPIK
jgi:hypothetical protein